MEDRSKFKLALSITMTIAISIYLATKFRKSRNRKQRKQSKLCYLELETPKKPQFSFKRVLADNSYYQFKHLKLQEPPANGGEEYVNVHPYKEEIGELLRNMNAEFVELFGGEMENIGDDDDNYMWVETTSQLQELAEELSKEKVFGVDTEQHSVRSFLGFTALIQISTKRKDYLVDTIALHDVMGILRPVFADPLICKVFHGADNDILWLQRDFHIYVVNLFDTAKACDVLLKPQKSLAYLLEAYCGIAKNKLLQREDWRQRPLPAEMVQYARMDAHYLLYIANCLALELKQYASENSAQLNDEFHIVLEASRRSNATCLQLYSKEIEAYPGESAAASIISRYLNDKGSFPSNCCDSKENCSCSIKFQAVVRRLCAWRDIMARVHDESLRYVLSEQAIVMIAAKLPTTEIDIYDTISTADLNYDSMNLGSFLQSPAPVVSSHFEDFYLLFQDNIGEDDNWYLAIVQKHLGSDGTCPLSIYNYALLSKTSLKPTNRPVSKPNGFRPTKQAARMASRELFVQKFSCKSPVYHNCRIFANDGRLLCYCDQKKLEWYLNRDLARLVEGDPPAIMLLFEPKGRPEDEGNDFYIQSKKNICVGCGEGNHYLRYRIIPSCYRMHFPEHLKSHRSHDIVLLCVDCHEIAHAAAEKYKKQIAKDFGIPLYICKVTDPDEVQSTTQSSSDVQFEEVGVSPLQLRTAAMALLRHGTRMPPKRREELTQIVMKYYGGREISDEDLEKALLVGMSPYERKRLHKKSGLALMHTSSQILVGSRINREETCTKQDNGENLRGMDIEVSSHSTCSSSAVHDEVSLADSKGVNSDSNKAPNANCVTVSDSDVVPESGNPLNGATNLVCSRFDENVSSKHDSKYSLLGHGPHGKLVVDQLLKEYGEDGIREFCQRWRQVFVEALHPRFLPAGWDVKHSGRRDFGEFSVYNPVKKVSAAAKESGE